MLMSRAPEPAKQEPTAPLGAAQPHTALQCLVAVARHHGVDLSVDGLIHQYALGDEPIGRRRLMQIARDAGFRVRATTLKPTDLDEMGEALPAIAWLNNGNCVILLRGPREADAGRVLLLDPLADRSEPLLVPMPTFCARWQGELLLLKRNHSLRDEDRPFGLFWFVPELLRQRRLFVDVTVAALFLYLLGLATPIFFQLVIDKVLVHEGYMTLWVLAAGITVALLFDGLFTFLRRYLLLFASNKVDIRIAARTFAHLMRLPVGFFETAPAGVLVKHMQQSSRIREFLTGRLFLTILDSLSLLVFLPVLFLYSPKLTLVVLFFTGTIALTIAVLLKPFRKRLRALYEAEAERQGLLVESIHGMQTVKALAMEPQQSRQWDNRSAQAVMMRYEVDKISSAAQAITGMMEKMMMVAIIVFGAMSVFDGALTIGALVAFNILAGRVSGPLVQLVTMVHEYQEVALSVKMLGQVMNSPPERPLRTRGIRAPIHGRIEFDNVSFRYGSEGGPRAIEDVSFTIPAGSVFGVVGRSGSGKTTITRLIQGLYPVQQGVIRIDGTDLRELDLVHVRQNFGVVLQDNFLFRGTVRENIATTRTDASFEEVMDAARLSGADEFIERLPRGFDTMLEENGQNLSGGQKQRLAIARALLTEPRILILDEATSALDPESEMIIRRNLRQIARGRTVVIISHRLSTLLDADAIMVLDRGRIADVGPHEHLLERCETYRQLWQTQTSKFT